MSSELNAETIIKLIEEPTPDGWSVKQRIIAEAPGNELILALQTAQKPLTRDVLCDIVGARYEVAAVPALLARLSDTSEEVRAAAADALGMIGAKQAGPRMLERFMVEEDQGVRQLLGSALGAVGYRPAIPVLIQALEDPDPILRGTVAWGLGSLGAPEAADPLRQALDRETDPGYPTTRLKEALPTVELIRSALNAPSRGKAMRLLIPALNDAGKRAAAAWALSVLGATEAKTDLYRVLALSKETEDRYMAERLRDALTALGEQLP